MRKYNVDIFNETGVFIGNITLRCNLELNKGDKIFVN